MSTRRRWRRIGRQLGSPAEPDPNCYAKARRGETVREAERVDERERVNQEGMREFVKSLDIPQDAIDSLAAMTPATYVGNASAQAKRIVEMIKKIE